MEMKIGKAIWWFLLYIMFLCVGCGNQKLLETEDDPKKEFIKENGVWLIEDGRQLALLSSMVAKGDESIWLRNWFGKV